MSEIQKQDQNKELAEKYLRGEIELESLTEDQVDLAFDMAEDFSPGEQEQSEPEETIEENTETEETEPPKDDFGIQPADDNVRLKEALEEANKYKQLFNDREGKLKSLKEDESFRDKYFGKKVETQIDPNKDYLDDRHLAKVDTIDERQNNLDERLARIEKREQELARQSEAKSEQLSIFQEIQKIQDTYSALKTKEPFQDIDTKFVQFDEKAKIGGVDSRRYLKDKQYREAAIAKGYKLDMSSDDMAKADKIYSYYDKYVEEKNSNYNTSIDRVFRQSSDYEAYVKSKYAGHRQADDDALERRIAENSQEVKVMGAGSGGGVDEADVERIIMEMKALSMKTNFSDKDEKRYQELDKMLETIT